ncbi:MAG: TRAP transporter small permease [Candidatus Methylomirabilales bacterium]
MKAILARLWDRLEEGVSLLFFLVMSAAILLQLVFRFLLNNPLLFPEEVARYCYVWITFLGLALATKTREHIRVEVGLACLPAGLRRWAEAAVVALAALLLLVLAVLGVQFLAFSRMSISPALEMPMNAVYLAFPIGCLLAVVRLLCALAGAGGRREAA